MSALLSIREVALRLRLGASTVVRLIDSGILVAVDLSLGGRKRNLKVTPEAIESFLESRRVTPRHPAQHTVASLRRSSLPHGVLPIV